MILNLEVEKRTLGTKSELNQMRKNGLIPAVVYSGGTVGSNIIVPAIEFNRLYRKSFGEIAIFLLKIDGEEVRTIIKEKQIHPVSRDITHIDFLELHPGIEISIDVPINFVGTPEALKEGAILDVSRRSLSASCLPRHIPEAIQLDISNMTIGDTIFCKDIELENVTFTEPEDLAIVSLSLPRVGGAEEADQEDVEDLVEEQSEEVTE